MSCACFILKGREMLCDQRRVDGDRSGGRISTVLLGCDFGFEQGILDHGEHTDGTGTGGGLSAFADKLALIVEYECALDADGVVFPVYTVPCEGGDFGTAEATAGTEVDGDFHVRALGLLDHGENLVLLRNDDLVFLTLGEARVKCERRTVYLEDGRQEAMSVTDGLGGQVEGFLVDGDLDLLLGQVVDLEGHDDLEVVPSDLTVAYNGRGGQDGGLGFDILINGLGYGKRTAAKLLVDFLLLFVGLEVGDLYEQSGVIKACEGLVDTLALIVLVAIYGRVIRPAWKLGNLW